MDTTTSRLLEELKSLGASVRQARNCRGLTLQSVADQADVGLQTLIRIEDGNPGVGALNLNKVLSALGLTLDLSLSGPDVADVANVASAAPVAAHPLHIDDETVQAAVEAATRAACEVLDEFLGVEHPEKNGIGSNFQGLLAQHIAKMLCGQPGASPRWAPMLKRLVYSDDSVGGPLHAELPDCAGWALRIKGGPDVLQDGRSMRVSAENFDPWVSRGAALEGFRQWLARHGHPESPVEAVPVYLSDQGNYRF